MFLSALATDANHILGKSQHEHGTSKAHKPQKRLLLQHNWRLSEEESGMAVHANKEVMEVNKMLTRGGLQPSEDSNGGGGSGGRSGASVTSDGGVSGFGFESMNDQCGKTIGFLAKEPWFDLLLDPTDILATLSRLDPCINDGNACLG